MIRIIDSGIIYKNPQPDLKSIQACFPYIEQLSEKELICIYTRGSAFASIDRVLVKSRSLDGGKTWVDEGLVWDTKNDDKQYCYHVGCITRLKDNKLIIVSSRWDRSDADKPLYNLKTEGYLPSEIILFWSSDNGHSWALPQAVSLPSGMIGNNSGCIVELDDGNFMLPFETWKSYNDASLAKQKALALLSKDGGKIWDDLITVADGTSEGIYYWDERVVKVGASKLAAVFWTHDTNNDKDLPVHLSISGDNGRTWIKPVPTNIKGAVTYPVKLNDGRLLAVYVLRYGDTPGIMAALSYDEGKTWDIENQVILWDALGQSNIGSVKKRELSTMMGYAFGMPSAKLLTSGEIIACFWCTDACITHVRWCKLKVE